MRSDPLGKAAGAGPLLPGTYPFQLQKLHSFDGGPLAASYYRSKLGPTAPGGDPDPRVGPVAQDFEDGILEGSRARASPSTSRGLDYAVLSLDLRGQGQNPRRALARGERTRLIEDIQAAYFFLVDRHNRGELNLSKLGVIAAGRRRPAPRRGLGQPHPGAAVTTGGHPSDLSALALISPMPEGSGQLLRRATPSLATRIPMLLVAGERDNASKDAVQAVRPLVERGRLNKIELYPSPLHGYKLLRLEPKVTSTLFHFLDTTLKNRAVAWEPQYNLLPITFSEIQTIRHARPGDVPKKPAPAAKDEKNAKAPAAEKEEPK